MGGWYTVRLGTSGVGTSPTSGSPTSMRLRGDRVLVGRGWEEGEGRPYLYSGQRSDFFWTRFHSCRFKK